MRLLVIEDDEESAQYVAQGLREEGHVVDRAADGRDGLFMASNESYDLLIVDRLLPGIEGLALVRTLRAAGVPTPVLFLTTCAGTDDRVAGLNAGGDDYLVKPFAFAELVARVGALGRRPRVAVAAGGEPKLRSGEVELDRMARVVRRRGQVIELLPREFRLLEYLMRHAGQVVTRTMLLENVWDFNFDPHTNVVETQISRLRAKLDRGFSGPELIVTVRGAGYCLRALG